MPYSLSDLNPEEKKQLHRFTLGISAIATTWTIADAITNTFVIDELREKFLSSPPK